MLNYKTLDLQTLRFQKNDFKVLLRHFYFVVNIRSYFYFKKDTTSLKHIFDQIRTNINETIEKQKYNINHLNKNIDINTLREFSIFEKVFKLGNYFKVKRI